MFQLNFVIFWILDLNLVSYRLPVWPWENECIGERLGHDAAGDADLEPKDTQVAPEGQQAGNGDAEDIVADERP